MGLISEDLKYCIFDPTGNITALVETAVDVVDQPAVASRIMELEPDVEQVGFVSCAEDPAAGGVPVKLRMAGGEFCGNATMCAAALFAIRSGLQGGAVPVKVAGVSAPFEVVLERQAALSYSAAVSIPPALSIGMITLQPSDPSAAAGDIAADMLDPSAADGDSAGDTAPVAEADGDTAEDMAAAEAAGGLKAVGTDDISAILSLPIVEMEGISHIIIEPDSGFFGIKEDSALAESLLRQWCGVLGADCLGMMFLGEGAAIRPMTPLVYVPVADTMFWENSCASGSAAAGMYLAAKAGSPVDVTFDEPAGRLRVESDPATGRTILHGSAVARSL